jgi:K+-sensing histidine kinase KdpD
VDRIPAIRRVILAEIPPVQAAAWAGLAVAVPTGLRWFIDQGEAGIPFVTYFPAVVLAALLLGWRWAAMVALASGVVANRIFTEEPLLDISTLDAVLVGLFALSCAALIWIGEMARRQGARRTAQWRADAPGQEHARDRQRDGCADRAA